MRGERPSFTASVVAFGRSFYASAPDSDRVARDHVAPRLLPFPFATIDAAVRGVGGARAWMRRTVDVGSLGLLGHVELRTLAIDAAVDDFFAARDGQLVILGAGLDARAWRLGSLARSTVFEVDHPSTQRYKRERIGVSPPRARDVKFVAVDFQRDRLDERLAAAGHDPTRPTFWIWEGVTMYLVPEAVAATLRVVRSHSTTDSQLAVTYTPIDSLAQLPFLQFVSRASLRIIGEPITGAMTRETFHEMIAREGLRVVHDEDSAEWSQRFWHEPRRVPLGPFERLVIASVT